MVRELIWVFGVGETGRPSKSSSLRKTPELMSEGQEREEDEEKREGIRWKQPDRNCLQCRRPGFDPWVRKIPWRRK